MSFQFNVPDNIGAQFDEITSSRAGQALIGLLGMGVVLMGVNAVLPNMETVDDLLSRFTNSTGIERFDEIADRLEVLLMTGLLPGSVQVPVKRVVDLTQATTALWETFKSGIPFRGR